MQYSTIYRSNPNSASSNSQSLNASIYGQSPVNPPPRPPPQPPNIQTTVDQLYQHQYQADQLLQSPTEPQPAYAYQQQQAYDGDQPAYDQAAYDQAAYDQAAYDQEQAAYDQEKAAYDYAVYNHQMALYNHQQQTAAQPGSPVSSHNTSAFYDNAIPPYPHIYQNQNQVHKLLCT